LSIIQEFIYITVQIWQKKLFSDAEFRPYIEYLSGKTELKYQIHLNALMNAYAATIAELLSVYPANDVEKLREDWAQENNNLLENEQRMVS